MRSAVHWRPLLVVEDNKRPTSWQRGLFSSMNANNGKMISKMQESQEAIMRSCFEKKIMN